MWQTNWACNLLSSKSKERSELSFSSASHMFTPAHQVASGLVYNTQEISRVKSIRSHLAAAKTQ